MIASYISIFYILYLSEFSLSMRFNSFKLYINHLKQLKYPSIVEGISTVVPKYNIVLGNEACDADSIISALCFAYLKSLKSEIYIPIVLTSRMNIHLKREVQLLLQSIQLDLNDLICSDEIPQLDKFNTACNQLTLTLTDHNKLSSQFSMYSSNVIEIIDHHKDSKEYSWVNNEFRNIAFDETTNKALVGSTCTLIAEKFFENGNKICSDIATLLMGVIALDTINMNNEAGIGTERDNKMLEQLQNLSNHSQTILFETLRDAKLDPNFWNQLNIIDCLKLDYKLFITNNNVHRIGISSILQPISDFLEKDNIILNLNKFINDQDLTLLVIMSFIHKPFTKREIFIYTNAKYIYESVHQYLLNNDTDHDFQCTSNNDLNNKLKNKLIIDNNNQNTTQIYYSVFNQGNVKSSRKQIAPKLLLFHEKYLK